MIGFLRSGPLIEQFRKYDVPVFAFPEVRMRQLLKYSTLLNAIQKIIHEHRVDLVHSSMAYGQFWGGRAANASRIKNVWFQHGPVGKSFDKIASLIRSDGILVNSKFTEAEQLKIMYRRNPTYLVYSAIEETEIKESEAVELRKSFRAANNIPDNAIVCGSVGRIQEWKGQLEFLRAFNEARRKNKSLKAVVCGSADLGSREYERKLKEFVKQNKIDRDVVFTGFLDNLEPAFRSFDLLVHSSTMAEPFGLVPLEGMIRGIPVIACPWGGPAETVEHGRTGLLVDPRDTFALATQIEILAGDSRLRDRLCQAGKVAVRKFLAKDFVKRIENIYDSIL
jgi:glycosyltransferase involved in cell wall biosynthesis